MVMPTQDEYTFRLDLMTMLFTKEEMNNFLVYKSWLSSKEALDKERVSYF